MPDLLNLENRLNEAWPRERWQDVSVLVAVSGGADSVALLRALARLKCGGNGQLRVAHFNHALRGAESDADQAFVEQLAGKLGISCQVGRPAAGESAASTGDGLEAAARAARYQFLEAAATASGARYVVVAHTADDQVETIVQRIFRGTGLAGLAGMRRTRPLGPAVTLIRPLLAVRRADVREYLVQLKQDWREDPTNASPAVATRNWLRHELLPSVIENVNLDAPRAVLRLAQLAAEAQEVTEAAVSRLADRAIVTSSANEFECDCAQLAAEPRYLVRELLIGAWRERGWPEQAMGFAEWEALAALALLPASAGPSSRNFPRGVRAQKKGARLSVARLVPNSN